MVQYFDAPMISKLFTLNKDSRKHDDNARSSKNGYVDYARINYSKYFIQTHRQ